MTLDLSTGVPKVIFSRTRENFRESINGNEEIVEDETIESSSSINLEIMRPRGQSLENELGCDEIMQQFINCLETFVDHEEINLV